MAGRGAGVQESHHSAGSDGRPGRGPVEARATWGENANQGAPPLGASPREAPGAWVPPGTVRHTPEEALTPVYRRACCWSRAEQGHSGQRLIPAPEAAGPHPPHDPGLPRPPSGTHLLREEAWAGVGWGGVGARS